MTRKRKPPPPPPKYSYAVRWRRRGGETRRRFYERRHFAERFARRLAGQTRLDLAPIIELAIERRVVGQWEQIEPW